MSELTEYLEHRSAQRRERLHSARRILVALLVVAVVVIAGVLAVRTVMHFTGWGGTPTVTISAQGQTTTSTPVSILP